MDLIEQWKIPLNWKWTQISELGKIVAGGTPSTKESSYWGDEINWITPADLSGYNDKFISKGAKSISKRGLKKSSAQLMPSGSIHFSSRAPIGYVVISKEEISTNQGFKSLVPANEIFNEYVYYYFKIAKQLAEKYASGTTFKEISKKAFSILPIPIAPLPEQRAIVSKIEQLFSDLDNGIENFKKAQEQLKIYRQAVLKNACEGKLVPTEAELARSEGRDYEPADVLLEQILGERREKWNGKGKYKEPVAPDTSGLAELPEGWGWINLGQITWSVKDGPHYSPKYVKEGIPFISGGNVRPNGIDFANTKRITPELHSELSKRCKPEIGDILYTKGGTTGIARVNTYDFEFNVWVHVAILKLAGSVEPFYIQHTLNSPFCYAQSQHFTHGVGNQDLGLTRMVNIILGLPPLAEQHRIVTEVERRLSVCDKMEETIAESLQKAESLRQSILKKAFEGKLLNEKELEEVRNAPDWEPAEKLLERIKAEKTNTKAKKKGKK